MRDLDIFIWQEDLQKVETFGGNFCLKTLYKLDREVYYSYAVLFKFVSSLSGGVHRHEIDTSNPVKVAKFMVINHT